MSKLCQLDRARLVVSACYSLYVLLNAQPVPVALYYKYINTYILMSHVLQQEWPVINTWPEGITGTNTDM